MTAIPNPQLDFTEKKSLVSKYGFTKLVQQSGGIDFLLPAAANYETIFELPPRVYNLSRSVIKFNCLPGITAACMNWLFQDAIAPIRQVQLYTRSGVYIADINNLDKYSGIVLKSDVDVDDAEVQDVGAGVGTMFDTFGCVAGRSNTNYPYDGAVIAGAVAGTANYYEPQYLRAAYGAAGAAGPLCHISIPLSLFKNTLFSLDKPLYFNEPLMLKIIWNTSVAWGFGSTSIADPTAGLAALTAANTVEDLYLYLALEKNPNIVAQLTATVLSKGLNLIIPFVYGFVNVGTTSTSQTISIRMNRSNGMKLKKIYHSIFAVVQAQDTRYNHRNVAGAICSEYWTTINNVRLQEVNVNVTDNQDDYLLLKEIIPNSIAASSFATFRRNWFILDRFDEDIVDEKDGIVNVGLDLSTEIKWDCNGTVTGVAHNYYTFAVVSRMLSITPMGIMIQ